MRRRHLLHSLAGPLAGPLALAAPALRAQPAGFTVAAAASVKPALDELAAAFAAAGGPAPRLVYGASGNLVAQILQGAPFHLLVAADEESVLRVADAGRAADRGRVYALGRLALIAPHASPLAVDGELRGLGEALRDGRVRRLAIANPAHAPYGQRAREALQHAGLWALAEPRLVYGENVAQALQFALGGSAQGGLVAQSLATVPAVARAARSALVPASFHAPLAQRLVLLQGAPAAARAFHDRLVAPAAREVWARHGFEPAAG